MKKMLLLIAFLPLLCVGQDTLKIPDLPIDTETSLISFKNIDSVKGVTKDIFYERAKEWLATTYKSENKILPMDDKPGGKLIVKCSEFSTVSIGTGLTASAVEFQANYTINLTFKDGRYRVIITNFVIHQPGSAGGNTAEQYLSNLRGFNKIKLNSTARKLALINYEYLSKVGIIGTTTLNKISKALKSNINDF